LLILPHLLPIITPKVLPMLAQRARDACAAKAWLKKGPFFFSDQYNTLVGAILDSPLLPSGQNPAARTILYDELPA